MDPLAGESEELEEEENLVTLNLASLLPMAISRPFVERATVELEKMGYRGVGILPFSWSLQDPDKISMALPVTSIERAWNPTERDGWYGLMDVVSGMIHRDIQAPKLQDFVAFPSRYKSEVAYYRWAMDNVSNPQRYPYGLTDVVHKLPDYPLSGFSSIGVSATILEINPGLNLTPQEISEKLLAGSSMIKGIKRIVCDTKHLRRGLKPNEAAKIARSYPGKPVINVLGEWENTLRIFSAAGQIGQVDLQAMDPVELIDTLRGVPTELDDVMSAIVKSRFDGTVRVEFMMKVYDQVRPGYAMGVAKDAHDYLRDKFKK